MSWRFRRNVGPKRDVEPPCALTWSRVTSLMFTPQPIGFVSSPYKNTKEIPKGFGAKHEAEGLLKILPELEAGLADIEGFSHLFVIWEF